MLEEILEALKPLNIEKRTIFITTNLESEKSHWLNPNNFQPNPKYMATEIIPDYMGGGEMTIAPYVPKRGRDYGFTIN